MGRSNEASTELEGSSGKASGDMGIHKPVVFYGLILASLAQTLGGIVSIIVPFTATANIPDFQLFFGVSNIALGVGTGLALINPLQKWPVFVSAIFLGVIESAFILYLPFSALTNPFLIKNAYIIAFYFYVLNIVRQNYVVGTMPIKPQYHQALHRMWPNRSWKNLYECSWEYPLVVIFLRHFGCSFCKETLFGLKTHSQSIQKLGARTVIVHMAEHSEGQKVMEEYGLHETLHISDKDGIYYKYFGLPLGRLHNLFNLRVLIKSLILVSKGRSLPQGVQGNPFQLSGVFIVKNGKIEYASEGIEVTDTPNWNQIELQLKSLERTGQKRPFS